MRQEWLLVTADDLRFERQQLRDEGRDVTPLVDNFEELIEAIGRSSTQPVPVEDRVDVVESVVVTDAAVAHKDRVNDLLDRARDLPIRDDYPYHEPNDITRLCTFISECDRVAESSAFSRFGRRPIALCLGCSHRFRRYSHQIGDLSRKYRHNHCQKSSPSAALSTSDGTHI